MTARKPRPSAIKDLSTFLLSKRILLVSLASHDKTESKVSLAASTLVRTVSLAKPIWVNAPSTKTGQAAVALPVRSSLTSLTLGFDSSGRSMFLASAITAAMLSAAAALSSGESVAAGLLLGTTPLARNTRSSKDLKCSLAKASRTLVSSTGANAKSSKVFSICRSRTR